MVRKRLQQTVSRVNTPIDIHATHSETKLCENPHRGQWNLIIESMPVAAVDASCEWACTRHMTAKFSSPVLRNLFLALIFFTFSCHPIVFFTIVLDCFSTAPLKGLFTQCECDSDFSITSNILHGIQSKYSHRAINNDNDTKPHTTHKLI